MEGGLRAMQLLENWDPLNLPRGSIRAFVTLVVSGVFWALLVLDRQVSPLFGSVVLIAIGHYFATRSRRRDSTEPERPALGLPRGTIRTLLAIGFGVVTYYLWVNGRLVLDGQHRNSALVLLCCALIIGQIARRLLLIVTRGRANGFHRLVANLQSIIVVVAVILLGVVAVLETGESGTTENLAIVAAPLVVFYFGARD
jgi:hypothetical protein